MPKVCIIRRSFLRHTLNYFEGFTISIAKPDLLRNFSIVIILMFEIDISFYVLSSVVNLPKLSTSKLIFR